MKLLVFTEGTLLIDGAWCGLPRDEIVRRSRLRQGSGDFAASVPIGNAMAKLRAWHDQGAEIAYLTSRTRVEQITEIQRVLTRHHFPEGRLWFRRSGEAYADVAAQVRPDVLIEDDCESIGGEAEMTYPHLRADLKARIVSIVVTEFGGIDHLPDDLRDLSRWAVVPPQEGVP